ncbi:hypothetical protein FSP39_019265 [Pinctada imbricata]|uniref:Splicing factor 4 n=1 Tax=Pinctada imbricata TaxID=66713 RepID=A0AA89C410_PINIB|nr:hypothetical protein FSP39_019265 [Pinctada imbricata]
MSRQGGFQGQQSGGTTYKEKMRQMDEQEKMIEEKKRKILEKLQSQSSKNVSTPSSTSSTSSTTTFKERPEDCSCFDSSESKVYDESTEQQRGSNDKSDYYTKSSSQKFETLQQDNTSNVIKSQNPVHSSAHAQRLGSAGQTESLQSGKYGNSQTSSEEPSGKLPQQHFVTSGPQHRDQPYRQPASQSPINSPPNQPPTPPIQPQFVPHSPPDQHIYGVQIHHPQGTGSGPQPGPPGSYGHPQTGPPPPTSQHGAYGPPRPPEGQHPNIPVVSVPNEIAQFGSHPQHVHTGPYGSPAPPAHIPQQQLQQNPIPGHPPFHPPQPPPSSFTPHPPPPANTPPVQFANTHQPRLPVYGNHQGPPGPPPGPPLPPGTFGQNSGPPGPPGSFHPQPPGSSQAPIDGGQFGMSPRPNLGPHPQPPSQNNFGGNNPPPNAQFGPPRPIFNQRGPPPPGAVMPSGPPPPPPPGAPVGYQGPPNQRFLPPHGSPVVKEETEVVYGEYGPVVVKKEAFEQTESDYDPSMPTEADSPVKQLADMKQEPGEHVMMSISKRSGEGPRQGVNMADVFELHDQKSMEIKDPRGTIDTDRLLLVSPPEDRELQDVIDQLAVFVSKGGPGLQEKAIAENKENPAFWFLYEQNSPAYKYYQYKVRMLTEEARQAEGNEADTEENEASSLASKAKRKRRSRWGPQDDTETVPPIGVASIPPIGVANIPPPSGSGTVPGVVPILPAVPQHHPPRVTLQDFARKMVGSDELNEEQIKQIKQQREMNMMYNLILAQKKATEAAQMAAIQGVKVKPKYEYDSDEETEGGTWEHRKRAGEMEATKEWAEALTDANKGKHFIGDFLPPDELSRFMETFAALKEGREPDLSDYKEFKLTCENLGYQMLQKLGWKEGEGLGSEGQGIKDPVNKGNVSVDGRGVGLERPSGLDKDDDEYDAFRKRMMLAYRFRPNPLNNPRRPYY